MWSSRARATVLREYMAFIPTGFSMYSSMTRGQYSSVQFIGRDGWGWLGMVGDGDGGDWIAAVLTA